MAASLGFTLKAPGTSQSTGFRTQKFPGWEGVPRKLRHGREAAIPCPRAEGLTEAGRRWGFYSGDTKKEGPAGPGNVTGGLDVQA